MISLCRIKDLDMTWLMTLLALIVVTGCASDVTDDAGESTRPAKIIEVKPSSEIRTVSHPAIIEASTSAELTFEVGGLLTELPISAGQTVEKGAVIARLDQSDFRNELASAQAEFETAESAFQRAERLLAEDAIARREHEQRKSQRDIARSKLASSRGRLNDTTLRSPFAGVIAKVHGARFQNVSAQEPIVTMQTIGVAKAAINVPASLVAQSERFETEETVVLLDAAPDLRIPAVFQSSSTQADPKTQTFLVKFAFTPPDDILILPGMTGTVESRLRFLQPDGSVAVPMVPVSAILSDGDTRYVWVVDQDSLTVSRREVLVAAAVGESLPILDGLEPGEVIVGAGATYLHEGMKVRPYEP